MSVSKVPSFTPMEAQLMTHYKLDDMHKGLFNLLLMMKGGLLKLNYCWIGRESWHAIKKLFNLPFLILMVWYPAIS